MRILWAAAIVGWLLLATEAHADTVYLKDGQTVWGTEITEQDDTVIVSRPSGPLRIPRRDVARIERPKLSFPQFYAPSTGESGPSAGRAGDTPPDRPAAAAASAGAGQGAKPAVPSPGPSPTGQGEGGTPMVVPPQPPSGLTPSK